MDLTQRPPYHDVDFKALAKQDGDFKTIWQKSVGQLDFQDAETTRILSKALLKVDFDLRLEVPDDRLCPPVPNRWNYVSWIQSLLDSTSPNYSDGYDPGRKVVGLDIGTGSSAIYSMLCLKTRPNWTMCATDVDKKSFDSAVRNLTLNNLVMQTKMLQTIDSQPLIPLKYLGVDKLDFTICNPPFFADTTDMRNSLHGEGKTWKPNAVCTGAEVEMVCPGGDLGFVTRILNESLVLREKVTWYTSLFGKMSSAKAIIDLLKKLDITNWAVGCIDVGSATKRWIVAWSFADYRPRNDIARIEKFANEYLPFPTKYSFPLPPEIDANTAAHTINQQASRLHLRWTWDPKTSTGIGEAAENVWKRAYRREYERKKKMAAAGTGDVDVDMQNGVEGGEVALGFRLGVVGEAGEVVIEWVRGRDRVLWESLCGMVHRSFKRGG